MNCIKYWLLPVLLFVSSYVSAQVSFVFLPEVQGRTVDGLFQTRLIAPATQAGRAKLQVTVTATSGRVVTITTPAFDLHAGTNILPGGLIGSASINFGNTKVATVCRQSGYFPEDDYEYCFELIGESSHAGEILGTQCYDYHLQPFSPLILTSPMDQDEICDKRPALYWQPLLPSIPGMQYRLLLTELKSGQAKQEALRYNFPIINQQFINLPMLFYPPAMKELEEGHRYIWQVTAYRNEMILATSEIWTFQVHCNDTLPTSKADGYRNIDDLIKGNFYLAKGRLLFAVNNSYASTTLNYSIICISKPTLKMRKLPTVKLKPGNNHINIDLSDNKSFVDGYYYQLSLTMPDGDKKQLRFLYKSDTE
ncbi:DUF928 domain-containing protein [Chitinophaga silvatica]|uniref:DUF928 domain-containing protein n=1 Tax=Chitinophaga silvatica TaxID=2282649 RepID=A0A3E1Y9B7_9BACT|nr:DUF928 domain-containing protein [Chitinophaga silvatica]RFS22049.1 DUF928 domain-containing protein [Chitinophaga silvatica]